MAVFSICRSPRLSLGVSLMITLELCAMTRAWKRVVVRDEKSDEVRENINEFLLSHCLFDRADQSERNHVGAENVVQGIEPSQRLRVSDSRPLYRVLCRTRLVGDRQIRRIKRPKKGRPSKPFIANRRRRALEGSSSSVQSRIGVSSWELFDRQCVVHDVSITC